MISVILPTYNRAQFLARSIPSILGQSLLPGELIIVDDGSGDESRQVVAQESVNSPLPIKYIYQENKGASGARNTGIKKSSFPFLAFLDSDDWWHTEKLEKQFSSMQKNPHYDISHTREIWYRKGKRVNQKKKHDPPHGNIFQQSLRMCMVGMSTVMIKKECFLRFGYFDENLACCEDYDLWLRMGCAIPFLLVEQPLIFKDGGRDDQLSVIHRKGMDVYRIQSLCNLLESMRLDKEQLVQAHQELSRKCLIYGNGCFKHGRGEEGQYYLDLPAKYLQLMEQECE